MVRTPLWYWIVLDLVVFYNSIGCVTQWHWCVVYLGCGIVYTLWYAILCYYQNQFSDEIKKVLSSGASEKMTPLILKCIYLVPASLHVACSSVTGLLPCRTLVLACK